MRTIGFDGFIDQFVCYRVQVYLEPAGFLSSNRLNILVSMTRSTLLEITTPLLVFAPPVVELATTPERAS